MSEREWLSRVRRLVRREPPKPDVPPKLASGGYVQPPPGFAMGALVSRTAVAIQAELDEVAAAKLHPHADGPLWRCWACRHWCDQPQQCCVCYWIAP